MSNVIEFLEKMGQNAMLRQASHEQITNELAKAQVEASLCEAILARDAGQLKDLMGLRPMFYIQMDEEDQDEERDDEEQAPKQVRETDRLVAALP
ncbi:hypothetical protein [Dyella sp.]|uniref:hypothetical protein n=1 Tax=Dyella sp. TaxID=1869338 RepID=UPI002ED52EB6